jgi:hypothetical protein
MTRAKGRPRHRWVDNIKMDHKEIVLGGVDRNDLAQGRDHDNEPSGSIKF